MQNTKVLEMINNGQIEELKALLQDEIFTDSIKGNGNAKKRYSAMKRYFKYSDNTNKALNLPCKDIEVSGNIYNSFVDGYTLVLTTESIGEMESYDKTSGSYFKVASMLNLSDAKSVDTFDVNTILAEAKAKGYKYKKSEIGRCQDFQYAFKYKEGYFKVGLLDQAFSIIDDGKEAEVYYNGAKGLLFIKTSIGIAGILPFNPMENVEEKKTVIEAA